MEIWEYKPLFQKEIGHLLEGLFVEGYGTVFTVRHCDKLFELADFLQFFGEINALAVGNNAVGIAMDDEEGGTSC